MHKFYKEALTDTPLSSTPTLVESPGAPFAPREMSVPSRQDPIKPASPSSAPHSPPTPIQSTSKEEGSPFPGRGTKEDPYIVDWVGGEKDNPLNWSSRTRYGLTVVVASVVLCVALGSAVFGGGARQIEQEFGISGQVTTLGLSLYVLGFACGPMIWAPLSEMYGRRKLHCFTFAIHFLFTIACGLSQNALQLLVVRFFAGFFGGSSLSNNAAVVSDMFDPSHRAPAFALFAGAANIGPVLGPLIGNFITQALPWRWIFWFTAIFAFVGLIGGGLVPETYQPVLLRTKAHRLMKASPEGGVHYISKYDVVIGEKESVVRKLVLNIKRPFVMLCTEMTVFLFSLYQALAYGILYMLFNAFPLVFEKSRGWSPGIAALPFIGVGIGMTSASVLILYDNKRYQRTGARLGHALAPEARLPICMLAGILLPLGLFWFAWTCQPSVHWISCCLATIPFGCGMVLIFLGVANYLVDSYQLYAASVLAASTVMRATFGAAFPLFVNKLFTALGNNWGLTLVAFSSVILMPIPFAFYRYGPKIRARSSFMAGPYTVQGVADKEAVVQEEILKDVGNSKV